MPKHTPGPWTYDIHGGAFYIFGQDMAMVADGSPDDVGLARVRGVGRGADEQEQEANARLMSAAPKLLEACYDMLGWLESLEIGLEITDPLRLLRRRFHAPHKAKLQAAIMEAEGGQ